MFPIRTCQLHHVPIHVSTEIYIYISPHHRDYLDPMQATLALNLLYAMTPTMGQLCVHVCTQR